MGVYLRVPNWDDDFSKLEFQPVILNRRWDEDERTDVVASLMVTRFEQSFVDIEPTCSCGATTGRHNHHCPKCNTPVKSIFDHGFVSDVWLQTPTGFSALILPNFLTMLLRTFKKSKDRFNAIEYLLNPAYSVPDKRDDAYQSFLELNIPRGYNYFVDNFDVVFEKMIDSRIFGGNTSGIRTIRRFVEENRSKLFPHFQPLPSKHSIITEKSNSGVVETNRNMLTVVDAARVFYALENADAHLSQRAKEARVFNAMTSIIGYRDHVDRKIMSRNRVGGVSKCTVLVLGLLPVRLSPRLPVCIVIMPFVRRLVLVWSCTSRTSQVSCCAEVERLTRLPMRFTPP